jgi:hypothetical protein
MERMRTNRILLLLVALGCGCGTTRGEKPVEDPTDVAQSSGPQGPDDKLICRKERVVGSHMRQEVCEYQSELNKERERSQGKLRELPPGQVDPSN